MSDQPTPLDPSTPHDADYRDSGHVFRRTSNMDGRWCIRCGVSYSRWMGDQCDSPHPDADDRITKLEAVLPLLVASPSLKERADIARRTLGDNNE